MANIKLPLKWLEDPTLLQTTGSLLELKTQHSLIALEYALAQIVLLDKKQQDYGPRNISMFGTQGVIIRMNDKMQRMITLAGQKRKKTVNESIKDSMQDISNYGIIGQMLEDERWPS